ncbi:MAG: RrF2 family transcriptional regulator [Candidatus Kapaibacteriota bacterium]|jgi:Rrf2 family protein
MVRFSKKIEYALGTLQYLGLNPTTSFSARELSEALNIPYEFLSKTLAQLVKSGILNSNQGKKGGYQLAILPREVKFSQVLEALGEPLNVVECATSDDEICSRSNICLIKTPMFQLQAKLNEIIGSMTLEDLISILNENNENQNVTQMVV